MDLTVLTRPSPRTSVPRTLTRIGLGLVLLGAGLAHLTVAREEFQAQVPSWLPVDEDVTVLASGVVEIVLGGSLIALSRWKVAVGFAAAAFFVVIFPGNVAQWLEGNDGFGLDTDAKRLARLPFQVVLVVIALWSTGAWSAWRGARRADSRSDG